MLVESVGTVWLDVVVLVLESVWLITCRTRAMHEWQKNHIHCYLEQCMSGKRTVRIFHPLLAVLYIHSSMVAKQPHTSYDKQW